MNWLPNSTYWLLWLNGRMKNATSWLAVFMTWMLNQRHVTLSWVLLSESCDHWRMVLWLAVPLQIRRVFKFARPWTRYMRFHRLWKPWLGPRVLSFHGCWSSQCNAFTYLFRLYFNQVRDWRLPRPAYTGRAGWRSGSSTYTAPGPLQVHLISLMLWCFCSLP